jgi:hypothetical protein
MHPRACYAGSAAANRARLGASETGGLGHGSLPVSQQLGGLTIKRSKRPPEAGSLRVPAEPVIPLLVRKATALTILVPKNRREPPR